MRKPLIIKATFIWGLLFFFSQAVAQNNYFQMKLSSGEKIIDFTFNESPEDSLSINLVGSDSQLHVPVDSIVEIKYVRKTQFWKALGIGGIAGIITGVMVVPKPKPSTNEDVELRELENAGKGVIFGLGVTALAAIGATSGAIIGLAAGKDDIYDLSNKSKSEKRGIINYIIHKYQFYRKNVF